MRLESSLDGKLTSVSRRFEAPPVGSRQVRLVVVPDEALERGLRMEQL